jgi:hypothetical protein
MGNEPKHPLSNNRHVPAAILRKLWERAHNRCEECGNVHALEAHHIVPVSEGGTHELENLRLLCSRCHAALHSRRRGEEQLGEHGDDPPTSEVRESRSPWKGRTLAQSIRSISSPSKALRSWAKCELTRRTRPHVGDPSCAAARLQSITPSSWNPLARGPGGPSAHGQVPPAMPGQPDVAAAADGRLRCRVPRTREEPVHALPIHRARRAASRRRGGSSPRSTGSASWR